MSIAALTVVETELRRPVEDHELLIPLGSGTTPPPSKSQRKKAARQRWSAGRARDPRGDSSA
eukprot:16248583-Heterocapsa_arctica.AAC.1